MSRWFTLTFLLPVSIYALGSPHYECGEHGRFEYCIDGVPGCVVGCHCHPGYYFDTETKICEPNAKLVEEYRRLYVPEPTRVQVPMTPSEFSETLPTPTTTNPLDNQVDAIAKDTDDLGDWLYNQFFKNIENQVSNSSNKEPDLLTRRSGSSFGMKKSKKNKKSKNPKKLKIKNKDLRRKLFRITEDDSLFNSASDSSTDTDDSGSSSMSSSSDTSASCSKNKAKERDKDQEHGHRKLVVVNKKPKAPLPSFIFLPNLETPFFPPIGLPPPPAVPMYPMVPVPPMFAFPGATTENGATTTPSDDGNDKKETQKPEEKEHDSDEKKKAENKSDEVSPPTSTTPETQNNEDEKRKFLLRQQLRNQQRNKMLRTLRSKMKLPSFMNKMSDGIPPGDIPPGGIPGGMPDGMDGMDLPHAKGKERMKSPRKHFIYRKPEPPMSDNDSEVPMFEEPTTTSMDENHHQDVNFKYLTQLIHKMDPNMTHEDLDKNLKGMNANPMPQRRTFETRYYNYGTQPDHYLTDQIEKTPPQQHLTQPHELSDQQFDTLHLPAPPAPYDNDKKDKPELDDSYYANLGQQIASFIRKIDNGGERQVNIEIEPHKTGVNHVTESLVLNENSYAPRSFWERSVRSPLNYFHPYTNEFDYNQRNYESLFNLESRIETIATTEKSLSLREIENVLFLMDNAKPRFSKKNMPTKLITTKKPYISTENLNINLLPRHSELYNSKAKSFTYYNTPITEKPIPPMLVMPKRVDFRKSNVTDELFNTNNLHYNLRGILMHNFRNAPLTNNKNKIRNDTALVQQIAQNLLYNAVTANKRRYNNNFESLVRRPSPVPSNVILNQLKLNNQMPLKQNIPIVQNLPPQKQLNSLDHVLPFLSNIKLSPSNLRQMYQIPQSLPNNLRPQSINYGVNRNNKFGFENGQMLPFENNVKPRLEKPSSSYFHHELHQFDYFD